MMMTWNGIISVARISTKTTSRPKNRIRAKAYAGEGAEQEVADHAQHGHDQRVRGTTRPNGARCSTSV